MFKFVVLFAALLAIASAKPGLIQTHSVQVQPAFLTKAALVDTSASSAITHQSFVNFERKVPVVPVVQTYAAAAPVVHHSLPLVKTVHHAAATPIVHSYAAAPLVHSLPIVHAAPAVKTLIL